MKICHEMATVVTYFISIFSKNCQNQLLLSYTYFSKGNKKNIVYEICYKFKDFHTIQ